MKANSVAAEDETSVTGGSQDEPFRLRSYQAEMVEESMKGNIIVAMDTGSGKTHIALSRTIAELEICQPKQIVWFLAPNVALCEQQFEVFRSNIPGYRSILLTGKDAPELWTDQRTWDNVLHNVRIVLSTHQVLLDALSHAFIRMSRLALLIFDEAHHCISNHPANRIMKNFYMPLIQTHNYSHLPRVLGLSASPVMKARATGDALQQIEQNLNATAKTPTVHRSELIRHVHKPELYHIAYSTIVPGPDSDLPLLAALRKASSEYDLMTDPYVTELLDRQRRGENVSKMLQAVATSSKTYCKEQLAYLCRKGETMLGELGSSVTHWYLNRCIFEFRRLAYSHDKLLLDLSTTEKQHLMDIFNNMPLSNIDHCDNSLLNALSGKVEKLVEVLLAEHGPDFTCLVFVEQRVWVAALAEILSRDARTKNLFSIGTFVGSSVSTKRKTNVGDLIELPNHQNTLDDFRSGAKNIIIATTVLEEGIDVSSCHLVICFEPPKNLKSFVQRRGRARKQKSKYLIFTPDGSSIRDWETLEASMKAAYLDDLRKVKEAEERELQDEDETLYYKVLTTGALLTSGNASQHLHHYCALLGSGPYVDTRPQFQFEECADRSIVAKVTLPISVDSAVREAQSSRSWRTERMAKNDAAFQAYKALHVAGLINDNLLPRPHEDDEETAEFYVTDQPPSLVKASSLFDPWASVAVRQGQNPHAYYRNLITIQAPGEVPIQMVLLMPCSMPKIPNFHLYWNDTKTYTVESRWLSGAVLSDDQLTNMKSITRNLLYSVFGGRMSEERYDFLWLLVPGDSHDLHWSHERLQQWNAQVFEDQPAIRRIETGSHNLTDFGLVSIRGDARKFLLQDISLKLAQKRGEGPQLAVIRFPKRRDFLHKILDSSQGNDAYTREELLDATGCIVSNLPATYSIFTLFAPSIIHKYEIYMIVDTLRDTILKPLCLEEQHLTLLVQAITSSATQEDANYQRLEFLGDCILKFISSVHLMAAHPMWTENYLTGKKGRVVSNGFLSRATLAAGLDKFIIAKSFTGAKWSPQYASPYLNPSPDSGPDAKILRSSKLLADVIESLIGLSYVIGGLPKAFTCIQTLLPLEPWTPLPEATTTLYDAAPADFTPTNIDTLEHLINYRFSKKALLLEALTHVSYQGPHATRSYERLEFLGDAVLDYIISRRLFTHTPELSHQQMHGIRTAMANAPFLAFRMFETTIAEQVTNKTTLEPETEDRALWQFLRCRYTSDIVGMREEALAQHLETRDRILASLQIEQRFPWHLFALNDAPKFLSDVVESVIGAVYVDSKGDVEACERAVERLGVMECLERILRDGVDCLHPKERLGHLAVEKRVLYVGLDGHGGAEGEEGGEGQGKRRKTHRCQVMVGEQKVGGPVEGPRRLNAETIAAWKAVRIIEGVDDVGMVDGNNEEEDDVWHDAEEGGVTLDSTY